MKRRLLDFISGILATILVLALTVSAIAISGRTSIEVDPINIQVNGAVFKPTDVNGKEVPVFAYNGTTYAPVRALAEAYGLDVWYDSSTNLAAVGPKGSAPTEVINTSDEINGIWFSTTLDNTISERPREWEYNFHNGSFTFAYVDYVSPCYIHQQGTYTIEGDTLALVFYEKSYSPVGGLTYGNKTEKVKFRKTDDGFVFEPHTYKKAEKLSITDSTLTAINEIESGKLPNSSTPTPTPAPTYRPAPNCMACHGTGRCNALCNGDGFIECSRCNGTRFCTRCNGKGGWNEGLRWKECVSCDGFGYCPTCDGRGGERCSICKGTGRCQACKGTGKA